MKLTGAFCARSLSAKRYAARKYQLASEIGKIDVRSKNAALANANQN